MSVEKLLDNLAQRIFLPEMDFETLLDYYVARTKLLNERFGYPSYMGVASQVETDIGDLTKKKMGLYEKLLWNKLVHPPQNVLFIVGGVGCGKTTSSQLIVGIMKDTPGHCRDFEKCQDKLPLCRRRRLHIIMDFDEIEYKYEQDFEEARQKFIYDLSTRMSSNLYGILKPEEKFEFIDFWNYEIERQYEEGSLQGAFSEIVNEMHYRIGFNWQKIIDDIAIDIRKEVFNKITEDPNLFLDYQCRFCRYVIERVYGGRRQCIFVILDNIDCASPALQAAVREVLVSYQKRFGNTFMVCLRPETLLAKPSGVAAYIIDIEPHCGPEPFDVVVDRLKRFVDNPAPFFRPGELEKELENHAHELAKEVYKHLTDKKSEKIVRKFIESLAGSNIRNALIMATNLLKLKIRERDFAPHELNRALISPPYERYSRSPLNPVENIFHVEGSPEGRLLVKPRILQSMRLDNRHTRTISELLTMCQSFGYKPEIICKACNEMMEPAHQLIISNAKIEYTLSDFLSSENDKFMLTYAGIGYADKLMYDLDYIQTVMFDCVVESSGFPILSGHGLLQRFRAVVAFLNELNKVDRKETLELKMMHGKDLYISNFGETMLTWEIIKDVCTSIWHVILFLESHQPKYLKNVELRSQMTELYKDIANIMNVATQGDKEVLGKQVGSYPIPKPLSQLLQDESVSE
jgi:ABC-type oligopeptide transport system ATPase subunit